MEEKKNPISEAELLEMAMKAKEIERGLPERMAICGKVWRMRRVSMWQNKLISNLAFDTLYWQKELKREDISRRKAKRLNGKIRKVGAKIAAHYVLGKWLWLIPFLWSLTWRRIYNNSEEVSSTINTAQTLYGKEKDFFIANLENIKFQLALSMRQVGESGKQKQEREASAESMLDEDASPKKPEDSKSGARSKSPRTTKR